MTDWYAPMPHKKKAIHKGGRDIADHKHFYVTVRVHYDRSELRWPRDYSVDCYECLFCGRRPKVRYNYDVTGEPKYEMLAERWLKVTPHTCTTRLVKEINY